MTNKATKDRCIRYFLKTVSYYENPSVDVHITIMLALDELAALLEAGKNNAAKIEEMKAKGKFKGGEKSIMERKQKNIYYDMKRVPMTILLACSMAMTNEWKISINNQPEIIRFFGEKQIKSINNETVKMEIVGKWISYEKYSKNHIIVLGKNIESLMIVEDNAAEAHAMDEELPNEINDNKNKKKDEKPIAKKRPITGINVENILPASEKKRTNNKKQPPTKTMEKMIDETKKNRDDEEEKKELEEENVRNTKAPSNKRPLSEDANPEICRRRCKL